LRTEIRLIIRTRPCRLAKNDVAKTFLQRPAAMQRNRLRNETDVHNSFYRTMELVRTRNRMESERLKALLDSHIEKHRQYELRTMQRAEDQMRRRLQANESRRRELGQRAEQDRAEEERLRRFREAARARQSFINFLIEHVRGKE
uniref:HSA domain-containing protein n=1 Tax=Macrostomum lignano TaxID=282301 RepID=A0A1I8HT10_9PLAT